MLDEYSKLEMLLAGLDVKASDEGEASELATGVYKIPNDGSVLPLASDASARAAFDRAANLTQSWGPKILQRKLDGIVGSVNWSVKNPKVDTLLSSYNLKDLSLLLATDLVVKGSAGLALASDPEEGARVYRLSGYIHALRNADNPDEITAILQSYYSANMRQTLKIFKGNETYVWNEAKRVGEFAKRRPDKIEESEVNSVAFYASATVDDLGRAIGEIEQLAPKLKNLIAIEARILRVSEISSYPKMVIKGQVSGNGFGPNSQKPSNVIEIEQGGDVFYLETSKGTELLLREKADLIANLNEIATLPAGLISSDTPSGEALKEVNQAFNNSLKRYAEIISQLLTSAFRELFAAINIDASDLNITINPNTIRDTTEELNTLLGLIDKRILPARYIARRLQHILPDLQDDEAEEIVIAIQSKAGQITTADLLGVAGVS